MFICLCVCLSVCPCVVYVYTCIHAHTYVHMYVCMCEAAVSLWLEHWLADRGDKFNTQLAAAVSLSKELYSHCSSPPSCINGDLAIAGEANAKL